jgi:hypothetical protein
MRNKLAQKVESLCGRFARKNIDTGDVSTLCCDETQPNWIIATQETIGILSVKALAGRRMWSRGSSATGSTKGHTNGPSAMTTGAADASATRSRACTGSQLIASRYVNPRSENCLTGAGPLKCGHENRSGPLEHPLNSRLRLCPPLRPRDAPSAAPGRWLCRGQSDVQLPR